MATIFCVDDEPIVLTAVKDQLEAHFSDNVDIKVFTSGVQALESLKECKSRGEEVPVIISDLKMPEMSGDDFLINSHEVSPSSKKILLSFYNDISALKKLVNHNSLFHFMSKPWTANDLFLTVNKAMNDFEQDSLNETASQFDGDNSALIENLDQRVQGNVLEMADMIKSHFLNNLNHEVRTPLNTIVGFTRLLKDDCQNRTHYDYLKSIDRSANDLLFLFDELLELTQNEASSYTVEMTEIKLDEFLAALKQKYESQAQAKGLEFIFSVPNSLPKIIYADKGKIYIILKNLLENAVKFTDKGSVTLSLATKTSDNNEFIELSFRVKDTGIGLPKNHEGKLFVPFSNFSERDFNEKGGVGVGLSIVKSYVQKLDGSLNFKSTGNGTDFFVKIPNVALCLKAGYEARTVCPEVLEALFEKEFLDLLKSDSELKESFNKFKSESLNHIENLLSDLVINEIHTVLELVEDFSSKWSIEALHNWCKDSKSFLSEYNMDSLEKSLRNLYNALTSFSS